jgi:hypothetical protein
MRELGRCADLPVVPDGGVEGEQAQHNACRTPAVTRPPWRSKAELVLQRPYGCLDCAGATSSGQTTPTRPGSAPQHRVCHRQGPTRPGHRGVLRQPGSIPARNILIRRARTVQLSVLRGRTLAKAARWLNHTNFAGITSLSACVYEPTSALWRHSPTSSPRSAQE